MSRTVRDTQKKEKDGRNVVGTLDFFLDFLFGSALFIPKDKSKPTLIIKRYRSNLTVRTQI